MFALFVAFFTGACVFMRLLPSSAYMRRPGKRLACATQVMNWPSLSSSLPSDIQVARAFAL